MRKRIPTITESVDELHRLLKAEKDVQRYQRVEMVYLLRSGQARTRQQVAALVGVHRHTVGAWLVAYEHGGLPALLTIAHPPGKVARLSVAVREALRARLAQPEGFASYGQIQRYLAEAHGVRVAYSTVHAWVRYRLQAKPKTPRPAHKKRCSAGASLSRDLPGAGRCAPGWCSGGRTGRRRPAAALCLR